MWVNLDKEELELALGALSQLVLPAAKTAQAKLQTALEPVEFSDDFIAAAKTKYSRISDGDLDWDDQPKVSPGDEGAYVMGWLWVSNENAGIEETAECNRCGETHPVGVMEDDMCPACVDAEDDEGGCSECGRPLDEAGDGYDGMCPTCADQAAATDNYPENWTKDDG